MYITARSQPDARLIGNIAPDRSQSGIKNKLMMPWKACVESMGQAMAKPRAVSAKEIKKTIMAVNRICSRLRWTPANGAKIRKIMP